MQPLSKSVQKNVGSIGKMYRDPVLCMVCLVDQLPKTNIKKALDEIQIHDLCFLPETHEPAHIFTDGSCTQPNPSKMSERRAAYGVRLAVKNSHQGRLLAAGTLPGRKQTAFRAELWAFMVAMSTSTNSKFLLTVNGFISGSLEAPETKVMRIVLALFTRHRSVEGGLDNSQPCRQAFDGRIEAGVQTHDICKERTRGMADFLQRPDRKVSECGGKPFAGLDSTHLGSTCDPEHSTRTQYNKRCAMK